jgi:hypothetical protein
MLSVLKIFHVQKKNNNSHLFERILYNPGQDLQEEIKHLSGNKYKIKKQNSKHYCCHILCNYGQSIKIDTNRRNINKCVIVSTNKKRLYTTQFIRVGVPWFVTKKSNVCNVIMLMLKWKKRLAIVTLFQKQLIIVVCGSNWRLKEV